ncbi:MAG: copper resistance protein B [Gammaproteobacteria bacterium]|nr:copper resistance protein B [Gammaproteobacteria bacterium]
MKKNHLAIVTALVVATPVKADMNDDPILLKTMIDRLEVQFDDGPDPLVLEAQAWIGRDLNKLWFKADVEYVDSETEEAEFQALYSRAVSPYWDIQLGFSRDVRPKPVRDWVTLGFEGLAPYWFEINAALFVGERNRSAARLQAEYEWMLTQRWVLSPEFTINAYSKDIPEIGVGAGISDAEIALSLRYEVRREFAPYIGVNWTNTFGGTADFAKEAGLDSSDTVFAVGVRAWF